MAYAIVVCYRCGRALVAMINCKTRLCPYCGTRITLDKARKVAFASSASDASEKLRIFNLKRKN
jgi:DNA-directed RNA polymerase subunit RPC12/RpoP